MAELLLRESKAGAEPNRAAPNREVQSRAQTALSASPIFALRELNVARSGDVLHLTGQVDSFYHKQLAQEVVRTVAGDCRVVNAVEVS